MLILILLLAGLGITVALASLRRNNDGGDEQPIVQKADCASCDGQQEKCEQVCMMEAAVADIEYFDDEDLDKFRGRASDAYTDEEAEEFREVLYTMHPHEAKDWNRSLILRGLNVPDQVKDELLMMISD